MSNKLFVGNLSFKTTETELRDLFSQHGNVLDVKIMTDRETGRARGFGFVTMENAEAAQRAANAVNNYSFGGRNLVVNEARPQANAGGGGGGFAKRPSPYGKPRGPRPQ